MKGYPKPKQFMPMNKDKYLGNVNNIIYRSSWELKMMRWCDRNPSVIKWNSEDVVIKYFSKADNKQRNYHMDFYVICRQLNGNIVKLLIEVKPYSQTIPPKKRGKKSEQTYLNELYTYQVNKDKWDYAEKFAQQNGMVFKIFDEYDLGIKPRPLDGKKK